MDINGADNKAATVCSEDAVKKKGKRELKAQSSGIGLMIAVIVLLIFNLAGVGSAIFIAKKAMDNSKDAKDSSQRLLNILENEFGMFGDTAEDDVTIAGQYRIKSTKHISDAYLSGDTSELSEEDMKTLQMAGDIIDEIITDEMTPYEKEKAVYDWMTANLELDEGMMQVIPTAGNSVDNPYGVLKNRKAVCVGFATTFRLFMQMLDIECMVIHNSECFHSWDLVKLDDEWYHVDIYSDVGTGNYANFNVTDSAMGCDWDMEYFPSATGLKYNYYYNSMVTVNSVYDIPGAIRAAIDNHDGGIYIKVKGETTINDIQTAETMAGVIDQYLMENYDMELELPIYISSYDWVADEEGNVTIFAVVFGEYSDEADDIEDYGNIDEEQANEALQGAFGDIFEDININHQGEEDWDDWEDTDDGWNNWKDWKDLKELEDNWEDWENLDDKWGVEPDINWEKIPDYDTVP